VETLGTNCRSSRRRSFTDGYYGYCSFWQLHTRGRNSISWVSVSILGSRKTDEIDGNILTAFSTNCT